MVMGATGFCCRCVRNEHPTIANAEECRYVMAVTSSTGAGPRAAAIIAILRKYSFFSEG